MKQINFFIFLILLFFLAGTAKADEIKINAGLLPSVWYSSLNISNNDQISIYTGMQNHSNLSFSFDATLYVDGLATSSSNYVSKPDTLIEIEKKWDAVSGTHSIQIKVDNIKALSSLATGTISINSLILSETDKNNVSVKQTITLDDITSTITQIASNTVTTINNVANALADNVEQLKKPISNNDINNNDTQVSVSTSNDPPSIQVTSTTTTKNNITKNSNKLSGTISSSTSSSSEVLKDQLDNNGNQLATVLGSLLDNKIFDSIYNQIIDFLSLAIRNWVLTLGILLTLFLVGKFII